MPKFKQAPVEQKPDSTKELDPKIVAQYQKYIEQLEEGNKGFLEFDKDEEHEMNIAKLALTEAGKQIKKYVRVRKTRGIKNQIEFSILSKQEFDAMEKKNMERAQKIAASKRAKK